MKNMNATDLGARFILAAIASVIVGAFSMATSYAVDRQAVAAERASHHTAYV